MTLKSFIVMIIMTFVVLTGTAFAGDKININTATTEQLQSVKGIGEKTAAAIIAYREHYGSFKVMADLVKVKGIGDKKLDRMDDYLIVE